MSASISQRVSHLRNPGDQPANEVKPATWPPAHDSPISVSKNGRAISRFGDSIWDFSEWAGKPLVLNMGDGPQRKDRQRISPQNANLLRKVAAWFLLGPRSVRTPTTLKAKFKLVRPIFTFCTTQGIAASELVRYPALIELLGAQLAPSRFGEVVSVLHMLYEQREELGFSILDRPGITRLSSCASKHQERQTPYIPPRIWTYVLCRSREFVDDYAIHKDQIEACFTYCLEKYDAISRSDGPQRLSEPKRQRRPFSASDSGERFVDTCLQFGIKDLLERWTTTNGGASNGIDIDIRNLAVYLSMVGYVGILLISAFSLMRIEEAWKLRCNCLRMHKDIDFGDIYLLQGETTKTLNDATAVWVTSKSTADAIEVMTSAARLRMKAASSDPRVPITDEQLENPFLVPRSYDPWSARRSIDSDPEQRQAHMSLAAVVRVFPQFLDVRELTIRQEDLEMALRINPTLDTNKFSVGTPWTLAWHQLRRTGAVNMFASGIVSDSSLQHQMKHSTLLMTHYYTHGFSEVPLNETTRAEILGTMYEMAARDASELFTDNFVSAYGGDRKNQALAPISSKDLSELRQIAKKGAIPWRETPFGGCTNPGPCEYGGFDHLIRCGGGDGAPPCAHGFFDRSKKPAVLDLSKRIKIQLIDAPARSPLKNWLQEMSSAIDNIVLTMSEDHEQ